MLTNNKKINISLVVPVYNSERTSKNQLEKCVKILEKYSKKFEILIADDASTDNTYDVLVQNFSKDKRIKIIKNLKNLGIAGNIQKLYKLAKNDYIIFYSIDGDWNPIDLEKLIINVLINDSDITIGLRKNKGGYSTYRKILSNFHNKLPKILFGVETHDAGSIKIIKKSIFKKYKIKSKSVFFDAEFIIRATKDNRKISTIPVNYKKPINTKGAAGKISVVMPSLRDIISLKLSGL